MVKRRKKLGRPQPQPTTSKVNKEDSATNVTADAKAVKKVNLILSKLLICH